MLPHAEMWGSVCIHASPTSVPAGAHLSHHCKPGLRGCGDSQQVVLSGCPQVPQERLVCALRSVPRTPGFPLTPLAKILIT